MRWPRARRLRRSAPRAFVILVFWALVLWLFLPYDSALLLWARFVVQSFLSLFRSPAAGQDWLAKPPKFPVDFADDVALILKTGYGTQLRVPAQLDALAPQMDGERYRNVIVIGDFATEFRHNGVQVVVHDVVAPVAQHESFMGKPGYERVLKYEKLADAIKSGKEEEAQEIGKGAGWEIDAMKFIPGLDLAYRQMPGRKWYIVLDDDTYILQPAVRTLLEQLDPTQPAYLGNAVGDFKGRFAHGGSAIILSWAAMSKLFDRHRHLIPTALTDSLTETWGDKLVATTFMRVGVYLDERYSYLFNGERPSITRIHASRFCSPILSFHGLAQPSQMEEVGRKFKHIDSLVSWGQLWKLYGQPEFGEFANDPVRAGEDHVGRTDEWTTTKTGVKSAEACLRICNRHDRKCLAWTWDATARACHISPWIVIGARSPGKYSGLNVPRLEALVMECTK